MLFPTVGAEETDGDADGRLLGCSLGCTDRVGTIEGESEGISLGVLLGESDGIAEGASLGASEGTADGASLGGLDGTSEGWSEGAVDGAGEIEGASETVGATDGLEEQLLEELMLFPMEKMSIEQLFPLPLLPIMSFLSSWRFKEEGRRA